MKRWLLPAALCLCLLLGLGGGIVLAAHPGILRLLPGCIFHKLTGPYCAGCGLTRGVVLMLQGDFIGGFTMNPLGFVLLGGLLVFLLYGALLYGRGRQLPILPNWVFWVLGGGIVLYTILRNLPFEPFLRLVPVSL